MTEASPRSEGTAIRPDDGSPPRWRTRAAALLPWLSLASGVAGALLMDRKPQGAWLVSVAAVAVWLCVLGMRWLTRPSDGDLPQTRTLLLGVARFSAFAATQSLLQLTLFFALPFFVAAATWDAGHVVFLAALGALSLASLWDPLTERLLHHPLLCGVLPATGSFAALTAVLPGLGWSTEVSLWAGAMSAALGLPLVAAAAAPAAKRGRMALGAAVIALLFPGSLLLGAGRIVPAAPLRLVRAEIGTARAGKWIADPATHFATAPARLLCATAIASPLGVQDRLFHVWTHDGKERARIELSIVGGRKEGFRTQSRIELGGHGRGRYGCSVETAAGQVLGGTAVTVGSR